MSKRDIKDIVKDAAERYGAEYNENFDGPQVRRTVYMVTQFEPKRTGMRTSSNGGFVKIEHVESGITVTKHADRMQLKAKEEALEELKKLVKIWEDR